MACGAYILGLSETRVSPAERAFFTQAKPWGFILFARNVDTPDQVRALCDDLRDTVGWNAPILIDQEGGRVQRLAPPHWRSFPPLLDQMQALAARPSDQMRSIWMRGRLIAGQLAPLGIDVNCAPLADLAEDATHPFLLNRLAGGDVDTVIQAGRAMAEGMMAGGVLSVLKHIPGHGRACVDSHLELPRVDAPLNDLLARDFAPFQGLNDLPMGMTAHIIFSALDEAQPATTSAVVMRAIRDQIGFDGLIMSDDLNMEALSGTLAQRAKASIAAGCDVALHCNGDLAQMEQVADACGMMNAQAQTRADRALALRRAPSPVDIDALSAEFDALF
jgi:beta-N-acetylhexosaminidase